MEAAQSHLQMRGVASQCLYLPLRGQELQHKENGSALYCNGKACLDFPNHFHFSIEIFVYYSKQREQQTPRAFFYVKVLVAITQENLFVCAVPGNCFSFSQELLLLVISLSPSLSRPSQLSPKTHLAIFFSKNHSHFPVSEFHFSFFLQSSPAGQTNREKAIAVIKEKVNCSHCFSSSFT